MRRVILLLALAVVGAACGTETAATDDQPTTTTAAAASDSAPATTAAVSTTGTLPSTTTTEATTTEAVSEDEAAIVEAYGVAFNSESTFEMVAPYLVEPVGLEETVAGYQDTGNQMGGVSVEIDAITIEGDQATVTYTLLFGGNPTYSDLTGSAVLTADGWQISRDMFCGLMTSARVGCPEG